MEGQEVRFTDRGEIIKDLEIDGTPAPITRRAMRQLVALGMVVEGDGGQIGIQLDTSKWRPAPRKARRKGIA